MSIYDYFCKTYKVSTDSRTIEPGSVFFALKGERFDGNDFAVEVANNNVASLVVADRQSLPDHPRILKVHDSLKALQELANTHRLAMRRRDNPIRIIAITGTNGKTTTKELVASVLKASYNVVYTEGNFNNHIGVPLTLLRIKPETEFAVVEMGANHPGEIATLCKIALPDYGLITNIGKAHLEGFGNYEGVVRTKKELYDFLKEEGTMTFVNGDNALLMNLSSELPRRTYGSGDYTDVVVTPKQATPFLCVTHHGMDIQTKLVGSYNFENVAAAIAVGEFFQVGDANIKRAIEEYTPSNNRSQAIEGKNHIIMDAYNANPTSMKASVMNFKAIGGEQPLPILGDMLELGEASEQEHRKILNLLKELGFQQAFLVGPNFSRFNDNSAYLSFPSVDELLAYLEQHPITGHTLLVKGSHGIHLEKILPCIQ